jgi:hypothetical protein
VKNDLCFWYKYCVGEYALLLDSLFSCELVTHQENRAISRDPVTLARCWHTRFGTVFYRTEPFRKCVLDRSGDRYSAPSEY